MAIAGLETDLKDYRLIDRLAVGGMAEVFLGETTEDHDQGEGNRVVIKRLLPSFRADKDYIKLFMDEAKLCVKLRHPNIVRTFKAFKKGRDYYMVQELVEGGSLDNVMYGLRKKKLRFPPTAAIAVAKSLLQALDYVHRAKLGTQHVRLVHRDVHPGNILVGLDGTVKLTDFGVAEGEGVGAPRVEGALRGTAPYMSPEQVRGENVSPSTDVFAAGVVLWELFTGRDLFAAESEYDTLRKVVEHEAAPPSVYKNDLPEEIDRVVLKALVKTPEERFQTAQELGRSLLKVSKGLDWGAGDRGMLGKVVAHAFAA